MSIPWRDDSWYHSGWTNWKEWSDSSECHDTKSSWSTPACETPADVGLRQGPNPWTEARSSTQPSPARSNNEASESNDAETDLNEKVTFEDVYWGDRTKPKLTMRSLHASFHESLIMTEKLHECVKEIVENRSTFMMSMTFNIAQDVYFPKFKPRECGYWKKLSVEEVHQRSHSNILHMIKRYNPQADPLAICDTDSSSDRWMLTGFASRAFEKHSTGENRFSTKEVWNLVNNPSPDLEECDKMIFKNLSPMPTYTEEEEVVTLYHTTDLSQLQDTVAHGLRTHFGLGCIDTSAIYGCPVPLAYASTSEPVWSNVEQDECTLVLLASEQKAVFKRDTQRGFINPVADLYIKQIICTPMIKGVPDNTEVEADKWTPIYCRKCQMWLNGQEQWDKHVLGELHSPVQNNEVKSTSENNDVETGGASRASNDADAAGQQPSDKGQSEQIEPGAANDGDTRHNTEMQTVAKHNAHVEHMLNVSNETRDKHADDSPVESLNPWLPQGTVRNIGSFTMFVFTYFKGEMWVLIHKLNKNKHQGNIMVSEGGSIGREAGRAKKKTIRDIPRFIVAKNS